MKTREERAELRKLAGEAAREDLPDYESFEAGERFQQEATPVTVIALLDQIDQLERTIERHAPRCSFCMKRCEPERWCYVTPVCLACVPPPPPIPILELKP